MSSYTSSAFRLGLYTLFFIGIGFAIVSLVQPEIYVSAQVAGVLLWGSFCLAVPFLNNSLKKDLDNAYLYYLGVSGLRMLVYMASLGLAVYSSPAMRNRTMVLILTVGFLLYTVVEVTTFVRKLREIFRSKP
jgi:hypothetical protein